MSAVDGLIELLLDRAGDGGEWYVTAAELSDRFNPVDYFRAAYRAGVASAERFDALNAGELLAVLEELTGGDPGEKFRAAGLWLTQNDRLHLTERFVRTIRTAVALHVPEPETFRSMLLRLRRFEHARRVYFEAFLPAARLVVECALDSCAVRDPRDPRARAALRAASEGYLRLLLRRHLVAVEECAPALMEILRTVARHEGMLPGAEEPEPGSWRREGSSRRAWALDVLGLGRAPATRREVQVRYRLLMRRYHPDVNPQGLETAKLLNIAYAVLLEEA